jgi:hypothetical protein
MVFLNRHQSEQSKSRWDLREIKKTLPYDAPQALSSALYMPIFGALPDPPFFCTICVPTIKRNYTCDKIVFNY